MSSFDKVVKLACKPKPAPPKPKYLDPIIAATWSEDGAVHDVCKALVPRLREPNAIVVFKALIVLHTMIRNGATDNVLSHLSSSEVLRLRNVSAGNWEGYNAPQNMQHYALYLDSRIRAYRELKHDAIRVQAETNRDMRVNNSIEEDMAYTTAPPSKASSTKSKLPQRSKTIMGRKLRVMTVEKGLLRETKTVQKMIDSLVECRFYLDDLEEELTITALRMLVKDLLILFQAGNEGVINVLEHYFEMSKYDAEEALSIYRNFCGQTERVVEYLGVAKKLQNLLNVPIPNLKHAPVSLANSLQEYLNDPNFEQNRVEYRASKTGNNSNQNAIFPARPTEDAPSTSKSTAPNTSVKPPSPPPGATSKTDASHAMADFFNSIEEEQTPIFNPTASSPAGNHFQQQAVHNPFVQRQMTGAFASELFGAQMQVQSTGFPPSMPFQFVQQPNPTPPSSHTNGFAVPSQLAPQHRPFSTFIPTQATGLQSNLTVAFLQPQPTGVNPFRQSMLLSQVTGMHMLNDNGGPPMLPPLPQNPVSRIPHNVQSQPTGQLMQAQQPGLSGAQFGQNRSSSDVPTRPASTPLTSAAVDPNFPSPIAQPVKSHQTGSRNPFGVPVTPAPPVPKPPTLLELSMGLGQLGMGGSQPLSELQPTTAIDPGAQNTTTGITDSAISSVASSFAFTKKPGGNATPFSDLHHQSSHPPNPPTTTTSSTSDLPFSSQFSQSIDTANSHVPSIPIAAPMKPQMTGFGGVKAFKPTSSFGASLLESLPPIPQSGTTTPTPNAQAPTHSPNSSLPTNLVINGSVTGSSVGVDNSATGTMNSPPMGLHFPPQRAIGGSGPGVGLRPQATGLGAANPFRATMYAATSPSAGNAFVSSASTPSFGVLSNTTGVLPAFGPAFGNSGFGPSVRLGQDDSNVQQQNVGARLI